MGLHRSFDYEQARRLFEEGASLTMIGQRFGVGLTQVLEQKRTLTGASSNGATNCCANS